MKLYYVHDPMCSWCWGFDETRKKLFASLPEGVEIVRLLGGLAPDSSEPMPEEMQRYLQQTWHRIQERIPGTQFNFEFWTKCQPRRSTWPSCRAVIAARQQGDRNDALMTRAIQEAYYLNAQNPSDDDVLIELARSIGLDAERFRSALNAPEIQAQLDNEMEQGRAMHATAFPSLVLDVDSSCWPVAVDYTDPNAMLETIHQVINT